MSDFASDAPPENRTRARLEAVEVSTWTTAQTDIHTRRRPPTIKHVREAGVSLLQAAFEQVADKHRQATRGPGAPAPKGATRGAVTDPDIEAVTAFLASEDEELPDAATRQRDGATRGVVDTVRHCGGLLKKMGAQLWEAKVKGNTAEFDAAQAGLTEKFGSCDPRYVETFEQYARFIANRGEIPYRTWKQKSDFVVEGRLPADARIGLVADWATGQEEALEVLRQIKRHDPHVVAHLGDIYYAGTAEEVENYFYKPWQDILRPTESGITSIALPGNHDLYAGGEPYYDLLDKLGQPASYICLRNADWQLIGLDTALNDKTFNPAGTPTTLAPSEVEWLRDKIENSGGRRTALMSHHQLFSTNDQWGKEGLSYNPLLNEQLADLLDKVDIWFWGHEHDLVVFDRHMGLERGRCIGGSAYPVSKFEMPESPRNADVPYNRQVVLGKGAAFYQHCYAVMRLNGREATVDYYEDSDGGRRLYSETF
jgi:predicted phosphodiesterase